MCAKRYSECKICSKSKVYVEALAREEEIVCMERISLRINVSEREFSSNHAYNILRPVVGPTMLDESFKQV